jgi:metalloendopeptidase OMA1, mitochondrial
MRRSIVLIVLGLMLSATALAGCSTAPVTGRQQLVLMSDSEAASMGRDAYRDILQKQGISSNKEQTAMVKRVGERITTKNALPGQHWEFNLINDDTPNAFALPGGYVGVNTGLFQVVKTEDQLAAVMGHEIGHVIARHPEERISREALVGTGAAVLGTAAPDLANIASSAATLGLILPFSREQETEADVIGLNYMAHAGYDPRAAVQVWQNFESVGGPQGPAFLSTHPSHGDRIARLQKEMPAALKIYEANRVN